MQAHALTSLDDALAAVLAQAQRLDGPESVDLFAADGRVLWADCVSALQVPPQDNSAMDGYALRLADVAALGVVLPVSQRIPAGHVGTDLAPGTAARIFTGAPVPPGADCVLMQEDCEAVQNADGSTSVRIHAQPKPGQHIRRAGEDIALGGRILAAGTRLTPPALGLAASIGLAQLPVARKPRVALFST
ncbi:MAG: molybdopterin molybdenumtransferase MoeA, partial [Comamonas sp.]